MAVWAETDFTGGPLDSNVTLVSEPMFQVFSGTAGNIKYAAGLSGLPGQSAQWTNAADFQLNFDGRTRVRIALDIERVSGTQTAGLAAILFRSGTTNRGDVFLRNQNGGQWSLRAGSGGTTYAGQSTVTHAAGTVWHIEAEVDGTAIRLFLWQPGNNSATPSESFTSTLLATADNVRLFNPSGATGLTMRAAAFRATDGEQYRQGAVTPVPGTVNWCYNGASDQSSARVLVKSSGATAVSVVLGGQTVTETPDSFGFTRHVFSGLAADTSYTWSVSVDGVGTSWAGRTNTLPNSANGLRFGWGSCWWDNSPAAPFANVVARNVKFVSLLGDYGYTYISTGPNGTVSATDTATVLSHRAASLSASGSRVLSAYTPFHYTYSDCDGGGGNADGTTGGLATGAVQQAYRVAHAHPALPLADCGARSWVVGRVRFIQTDETTLSSSRLDTDGPSKTKLGASQKAWFKSQISAAVSAGQAVVWFGDGPWIEATQTSGNGNSWARYNTERTEIGQYIASSGVKLIRLHGDSHTLFADNGTNNPWGGFPTCSAAPMNETAQPFGGTVSGGKWPTATTNSSRQYGIGAVTDDGTTLTLDLRGYSSTTSATSEVERFAMQVAWNMSPGLPVQPWVTIRVGNSTADRVYVGSSLVWVKPV